MGDLSIIILVIVLIGASILVYTTYPDEVNNAFNLLFEDKVEETNTNSTIDVGEIYGDQTTTSEDEVVL